MEKQYISQLETQINELHTSMGRLATEQPINDLLKIIHKPGWTTIAEQAFFMGMVDLMLAQTKHLSAMKQVLISGAEKVELNPQPLPPKA